METYNTHKAVTKMDKSLIQQAATASRTAVATMTVLSFKKRSQAVTNLQTIKSKLIALGESVVDKDYMAFWRMLEDAGAGSIILGRRGKQTRFFWDYSLKDVLKISEEGAAKGAVDEGRQQPKKQALLENKSSTDLFTVPEPSERLVLNIPFRGYILQANLPGDTRKEELEEIKRHLTIP